MARGRFPLLLVAAFLAVYFIWGSTYLAIRVAVHDWPPLLLAGLRSLCAGALLYGGLRWRGLPAPTRWQWRNSALIGFLLLTLGNGGVTYAESLGVASGMAALGVATVPLFALLFGLLLGQRYQGIEWLGIALGLLGIVLLNLGDNLSASPLGAFLLLLAAASWAGGSIWSKSLDMPKGLMGSACQLLAAGVFLILGSWANGESLSTMPSLTAWAALAYLVFFGSLLGFSSYLYLLQHVRPAAAMSYAYVNPVVAVVLGIVFAGEQITAAEGLAMLLITLAVFLISLPQWRNAAKPSQ